MKMEEYDTVEQMATDVELMINNALAYYKVQVFIIAGVLKISKT